MLFFYPRAFFFLTNVDPALSPWIVVVRHSGYYRSKENSTYFCTIVQFLLLLM